MSNRVVCPGCSCLCDGLTLQTESNIPVEVASCSVGRDWFSVRTIPEINSLSQDDSAIKEVSSLLLNAKMPLITGIENLTTCEQQAAVKVADQYLTGIDSGWSNSGRGSVLSFQRYGKVTATLGEISHRSDLVVLWFCDPATTHPRFVERFVRSKGESQKRLIVIDEKSTETAKLADQFIQVASDDALAFLRELRRELRRPTTDTASGLIQQLTSSSYGAVFVGKPRNQTAEFDPITDQWFQLVRDLNNHTRCVMGSLPTNRNGQGANNVVASLSGFPDAVRFTEAGPIHNGTEYSTATIVQRRECDMLLVCDIGTAAPFESNLDTETVQWLKTIPVVVFSDLPANEYATTNVHIPVGTPGWTTAGDFVRCDDTPIPMDAISGQQLLSAGKVFESLTAQRPS